jgi:hypothetical protein
MKKHKILLLLVFLTGAIALNAQYRHYMPRHNRGRVIATPLDGGLLTILGAAGISYYLVRKKENK